MWPSRQPKASSPEEFILSWNVGAGVQKAVGTALNIVMVP
jgi:hypothetical protein